DFDAPQAITKERVVQRLPGFLARFVVAITCGTSPSIFATWVNKSRSVNTLHIHQLHRNELAVPPLAIAHDITEVETKHGSIRHLRARDIFARDMDRMHGTGIDSVSVKPDVV